MVAQPGEARRVAGHRVLPHPADLVVEAWGPTLADCLTEAVLGLVSSFADAAGLSPTGERGFPLAAAPAEDQLVTLLGEVIFGIDADGVVPVNARVEPVPAGGFAVHLGTVDAARVAQIGPVPKAVARSGLEVCEAAGCWSGRALVDV
jgi:SHS2 domain-containing protein